MTHSNELGAWLLPIDATVSVAVGRYELKYIEYISASIRLPGLPAYCEEGFLWRDRFVPALDLHELLTRRRTPPSDKERMVAIISYDNAQGDLDFGAIFLRGAPRLLQIRPEQSVALATLDSPWQLLAHAAFNDGEHAYPVLDLGSLFNQTPVDLLSIH